MLQIAVEIAAPPPPPPRVAPVSVPAGRFEQMIEQLAVTDPDTPPHQPPPPPLPLPVAPLPVERQDLAGKEGGTAPAADATADEDETPEPPTWLPAMFVPIEPKAAAPQIAKLGAMPPADEKPPVKLNPLAPDVAELPQLEIEQRAAPLAASNPPDIGIEQQRESARVVEPPVKAEPSMVEVKPAPASQPPVILPAALALQPIAQMVFASRAIEPPVADARSEQPTPAIESASASLAPSPAPTRVEAPARAQDAPLDTGRGDWMEAMIERIDTLREQSGDRSAQIRLRPDALGAIDVRIRHQGEQVHINFAAESAAVRALLNDAAPRLAELAEARGLKLGDTGVGEGFGGDRRDTPREVDHRLPNRAPRAAVSTTADRSVERIA